MNTKLLLTCAMCMTLTVQLFAQSERSLINSGNALYDKQKFNDAEVNYRKALDKNKELMQGAFNLGDALYKQGKYDEAIEQYQRALSESEDSNIKGKAYHNIGNALLKNQKIQESIGAYKSALKMNPSDYDTKYNLAYALRLLQQQQQQQNQQQNKQNKDKNQQNQQNQQNQDDRQQQNQQSQPKQSPKGKQEQKMSPQQAQQILNALNNDEKKVQKQLRKRLPERGGVDKDW